MGLIMKDDNMPKNFWREFTENQNLSYRAKGIMTYLVTHASYEDIDYSKLAEFSTEGKTAVRTAVQELTDFGLLKIKKNRNDIGRIVGSDWILFPPNSVNPIDDDPDVDNTKDGGSKNGKPAF